MVSNILSSIPQDKCPPFLTPDMHLKIYLENLKTPHRWTTIAKRIEIGQNVDNLIIKNKALEIERKIKDDKNHNDIIPKIPFELENIIEYLHDSEESFANEDEKEEEQENEEDVIFEYEEEVYEYVYEEEEEEEENGTDDETMNPY